MEATGTVDECLISRLLNQVSGTFLEMTNLQPLKT